MQMQHIDSQKRDRTVYVNDPTDQMEEHLKYKVVNRNKSKINDFQCQVYFRDQIFDFQLSNVFSTASFAVLFFCPYDFSEQSRIDLTQIEENYSKFIERSAIPIVITHDRAHVHWAYASPDKTTESLKFKPSFILASDSVDKLISTSYKAIDMQNLEMIRSVVVIDSDLNIVFTCHVPPIKFFPIQPILNCFQ
ncbi:uncharacterized protein EV154DRAFT_493459 [Mucor mucedo]|uniref:uncharacterized protein n=1 Tax=Mucor mucedo TaxID=29922 RepID=UPI00221F4B72|nr:uncharacterized protein EV154DRAFT_493459 [Mucor mucedo]KAI7896084.1 hypothetical protein EV154DRAFT_493459 [Mucor mucedo]